MLKKTKPDTIGLHFGIMYPSIPKQLRQAGMVFDPVKALHWEEERKAIHRLGFGGILPDHLIQRCFQKLIDKIGKNCSPQN